MATLSTGLSTGLLTGCANGQGSYPSLAIRDAERISGTLAAVNEPAPPAIDAPAPLSQNIVVRLAQLQSQASRAHKAFLGSAPAATRMVNAASGSDVTTDRWASAQIALADLESTRSVAAVPLGDLDVLFTDATLENTQRDAISAARDSVVAMISEEDRILAALRNRLPS